MQRATLPLAAVLLAACGPAATPVREPPAPPPPPCIGSAQLQPAPIDVPDYPIARVPLDPAGRAARVAELEAAHPGWRFGVTEYGTVQRVIGEPTYPFKAPFDVTRFTQILTTLQGEHLVALVLQIMATPHGVDLLDAAGANRGHAQMNVSGKGAFIDVVFQLPGPEFPPVPGAHMLTQAEVLDLYDPAHDHLADLELVHGSMPCDPSAGPAPEAEARCVSVRELGLSLAVLGDGHGHQHLVYAVVPAWGQIKQAGIPLCIDAFTGAGLPYTCSSY